MLKHHLGPCYTASCEYSRPVHVQRQDHRSIKVLKSNRSGQRDQTVFLSSVGAKRSEQFALYRVFSIKTDSSHVPRILYISDVVFSSDVKYVQIQIKYTKTR